MPYTVKKLPQSQVQLTITVSPEEYEKDLQAAANRISERVNIKGFRKGKAPYEKVKQQVGEMGILQEALETILRHSYHTAVVAENLDIIGTPEINMEKMAPGNDLVYTATVALLPQVTLADISKIKVEKKIKKVEDKQVSETIDALRGMQAQEVKKDGAAGETDKMVIDMDIKHDKVPVEGGQSKGYQVYLSEKHYIPGFNEQLIGLKPGEEKSFTLEFPKDHYQKHLAGKKAEFEVKVKDVFTRTLPELNDEFAQKLGQKNVAELKDLLKQNKQAEEDQKADQRFEIELLDQLIEKSKFEDIPNILVTHEKQKMFQELKRDLEKNGVTLEQYLSDIKKKEEELFADFEIQAVKRAKAALISRQVAKNNNIQVEEKELEEELSKVKEMYKDHPDYAQYKEHFDRPEVKETIATTIQNRKVMDFLKENVQKV
ncbi:MAG: trigger factor [Candidatus Magasanikbacteria bacterium CG11_big_fil_rev_8_21_14_0_20_39_34]|uniref:Trigger factor n=1 Tax=Candidatus Magasanikbacteria bacterium CG11_big_fil_rev_8_21_14_0_20_39_34 TaxID=1974653 RepID=A0A2H0N6M5_9BACT|nr:MAG: trigger factor [Candidatus Magasanikbacteria bacterium CG11_big_fil_rev_8_21_14_0_20_39_34]